MLYIRYLINQVIIITRKRGLNYSKAGRPFNGMSANSTQPDQTLQNAASDQVLHHLLTECTFDLNESKTYYPTTINQYKSSVIFVGHRQTVQHSTLCLQNVLLKFKLK